MTPEERDIITRFIARIAGQPAGGSVPANPSPLPPIDAEADALIGELFTRYPDARYRLTQMAFVQEHALAEAENRRRQLEWELAQARQAAQAAAAAATQAQQAQPAAGHGFLGGLFGTRPAAPPPQPLPAGGYPPPPPPSYAPGYQPGMFQRSGPGFLGSALTTAAGVAGGMVLGNALMGLFSPTPGLGSGFAGGGPFAGASPWSNPGGADPWSQGAVPGTSPDALPSDAGPADSASDPGQFSPGGPADADPDQGGYGADPGAGGLDPGQDSDDYSGGDPGGADDSWV